MISAYSYYLIDPAQLISELLPTIGEYSRISKLIMEIELKERGNGLSEDNQRLLGQQMQIDGEIMEQDIKKVQILIRPPMSWRVFGNIRFCVYGAQSVIIFIASLIGVAIGLYVVKTVEPGLFSYAVAVSIIYLPLAIMLFFQEVEFVYHRTPNSPTDLRPIGTRLSCEGCLTFKDEHVGHCYTCRCCVRNFKHHCGFIGVCIDRSKFIQFCGFVVYWCIMLCFVNISFVHLFAPSLTPGVMLPEAIGLTVSKVFDFW